MNIKFQRIRFEKQFPNVSLEFNEEKNQYVCPNTQLLFEGWLKCVETLKEDNVTLYFSRTYGWRMENTLECTNRAHFDHPEFDEESDARKWAEERGFIVFEDEHY